MVPPENGGFRQKTADLRLRLWLRLRDWRFIPPKDGGFRRRRKSSASIIRATCTFDAKKVLEYRFVILVTRCQQGSYKLFENFYFCSEVSAFLIENTDEYWLLGHGLTLTLRTRTGTDPFDFAQDKLHGLLSGLEIRDWLLRLTGKRTQLRCN